MRLVRIAAHRFRSLFRRSSAESEMQSELDIHPAQLANEHIAAGMDEAESRRAARLEFGSIEGIKEECRDMRRVNWMQDLGQDLVYALRLLSKSPVFTLTAVLSLALGIGANTAVFSVIDPLMLRQLPVPEPGQLVMFRVRNGTAPLNYMSSYPRFEAYRRDLNQFFSDLSAASLTDRVTASSSGGTDGGEARIELVSGNYFSLMRVNAWIGRTLTPDDDRVPGGHPVAVISPEYAQRRFGHSADWQSTVLGRTLTINGVAYSVIGVTPRGFSGDWIGRPVDVWIPAMMQSQIMSDMPGFLTARNGWVRILGRLRPGITMSQAQSASRDVFERLLREESGLSPNAEAAQYMKEARFELASAASGFSPQRDSFGHSLEVVMGMVTLLLLLVCANVANLLMARASSRRREMAVRLAIGAARARIVRQLLTESIVLAGLGGTLGLAFTLWMTSALSTNLSLCPAQLDSRNPSAWIRLDLHPEPRVFAFSALICLFTGIGFGLAPAFRGSSISLWPALLGRIDDSGSRGRVGPTLVILQVAISLVLVTAAGLLAGSLRNLRSQDLGFQRDRLLLVWAIPGQTNRQGQDLLNFWRTVQVRISALPGVLSASISNQGMLNGWEPAAPAGTFMIQGQPPRSASLRSGPRTYVTSGYFETVGVPLVAGRTFSPRDDENARRVVIITESMARAYFAGQNPIGQRIAEEGAPDVWTEVVGVVRDSAAGTPRATHLEVHYLPYRQFGRALGRMCIAVRAAADPATMEASLRGELRKIDPALPVLKIDTIEEQLDDVLVQERLMALLSSFFGVAAAVLACLGLYGLMSYIIARRSAEIGIRLALGATRASVLGMVLWKTVALVLAGIVIGVSVALASGRLISAKLFGVTSHDPFTIAGAATLMLAIAVLAGWVPAWRASRVDPMIALR
jgi:predicted permease